MKDLRIDCYNHALNEIGLTFIFRQRALSLNKWLNLTKALTILSVAVPGAVILNYSINSNWVKVVLAVAVLVSVFLTISSIIELSYSLNNKLQYYYESASHHSALTREFESLAKSDVFTEIELNKYNRLIGEQTVRDTQDERYNISTKEERKGMRYGLRHFQRECVGCSEVPLSLESTNCEICGKY